MVGLRYFRRDHGGVTFQWLTVASISHHGLFERLVPGCLRDPLAVTLMLAPNGGSVAVLASSGLNQPPPQTMLDKLVVQNAFSASRPTLGDAILRGNRRSTIRTCAGRIFCSEILRCELRRKARIHPRSRRPQRPDVLQGLGDAIRRSGSANPRIDFLESREIQRLRTVGKSALGTGMDFNNQPIGSDCHGSTRDRRYEALLAGSVRGIGNDRADAKGHAPGRLRRDQSCCAFRSRRF